MNILEVSKLLIDAAIIIDNAIHTGLQHKQVKSFVDKLTLTAEHLKLAVEKTLSEDSKGDHDATEKR